MHLSLLMLLVVGSKATPNRAYRIERGYTQFQAGTSGGEACDQLDDNPPGPPDEAAYFPTKGLNSSDDGRCQWVIGAEKGGEGNGCRRWEVLCDENSTNERRCNDSSRVWHECSYDVPLACAFIGVFHNPVHHRYDRQPCGRPRCQCLPGLIYEPKDDSCGSVNKLCGLPNGRKYLSNFGPLNYTALYQSGQTNDGHVELRLNVPEYKREFHFVLTPTVDGGGYKGYDALVPGSNISAWKNKGHLHEGVIKYPDGAIYYIRDGDPYIGRVDIALLGAHSVLYTQRDVVGEIPLRKGPLPLDYLAINIHSLKIRIHQHAAISNQIGAIRFSHRRGHSCAYNEDEDGRELLFGSLKLIGVTLYFAVVP